jgi:hypothetical protein
MTYFHDGDDGNVVLLIERKAAFIPDIQPVLFVLRLACRIGRIDPWHT